ncbi:MAG TPA: hypothetical protein VIL30_18700 [Ramlibacter sp.]|jgi:hypothetical protein
MSAKPDDISQEAWDAADPVMKWIDAFWADELSDSEKDEARECIAGAIMAAKAEEREACAALADEYVWNDHALAQATDIGRAVHHQSVEIATAIRKRGTDRAIAAQPEGSQR